MTYKLVSVKSVLAKVIADLDLSEEDIKISDFREWCGEAVEKIGAVTQLVTKVGGVEGAPILKLNGHQAALPCDLHQLHQVGYSFSECGPWFPMRKAVGSFNVWKSGCDCGKCDKCKNLHMIIQDSTLVDLMVNIVGNIDKSEALRILNENQNAKTILSNLINLHTEPIVNGRLPIDFNTGLQYNIKPGYIMCNVPCGYLKLSYNAVPTDEDGYPMIPDLASFFEAVYWYIAMKYMYPKKLRGEMNRNDYDEIKNSWNFYRKQAYAELLMPNLDEMETLKGTWNRLMPELYDHSTFYSVTGNEPIIYNH